MKLTSITKKIAFLFIIALAVGACSKMASTEDSENLYLVGDINGSSDSLLEKQAHLEASIGNQYDCKVPSNKGFICIILEGSDSARYELAFADKTKFDNKLIMQWNSNHQLLRVSGNVELKENSKGDKIPSLIISKIEPINNHSDAHFKLLNSYFAQKKAGNTSAQKQNKLSEIYKHEWSQFTDPRLNCDAGKLTLNQSDGALTITQRGNASSFQARYIENIEQNSVTVIANSIGGAAQENLLPGITGKITGELVYKFTIQNDGKVFLQFSGKTLDMMKYMSNPNNITYTQDDPYEGSATTCN